MTIRATAITSKTVDFELDRKFVTRGDTQSGFPITIKLPVHEAEGLLYSLREAVDKLKGE